MARRTLTVASRAAGPAAPLTRAALRAQVPADIDRASSGVPPARGAAPGGPTPHTPSRSAVVFDDVSDVSPSSSSSGSVLLCNGQLPTKKTRPAPRTDRTRLVPPPSQPPAPQRPVTMTVTMTVTMRPTALTPRAARRAQASRSRGCARPAGRRPRPQASPPPLPYCCPYPCPYCTTAKRRRPRPQASPRHPPSLLLPLPMSLLYNS